MIKTINAEYTQKNKELLKLKVKMLKLFNSVNIKALTQTDQTLLEALIDDPELDGKGYFYIPSNRKRSKKEVKK
jgi:hypothetical protein